ncbi:putative ABC transport system ATP-binding protein [Clostridium punense]|uniref:ABC transport system ATP-binding protein n=1 Tax=Clostridium punense TaxID=1054297 RepID=A0ABS4K1V1_9CLOT|nr:MULTISPECIES: ABC transporter ATP-binding protein [Clostridium]EQB86936.1 peptide ABC transporter ATP-binding protein [Clostridium sp. BL8]MBP2021246.1 putative ABC transport system ATP-binding protein [Clostridium punense]
MELLRTRRLTKTYGIKETEVKALKPTDISIEKGEFTAIVGPSGSGKSTLLHLLAGLDKPSAGQVFINDTDIYSMGEKELSRFRRRNIGFIFQFFNLIPILSVEENIKLPLLMDGKKVDEAYINEIMETLDIKNRKTHLPGEISGGQQQRTSIARALANKPSIIFADEPTGNLDSKNSNEVLDLLTMSIKKYNQTLVMITHDPNIAARADRVITIADGIIVDDKRVK